MAKVKRSLFKTFLNVGTPETPDYALLGDGVTNAEIQYNPQTSEETYIHEDSGTTEIESYRPTMPVEMSCVSGDDVFDFIDGLRQSRAVLDAAKTDIVNVWIYEDEGVAGYPAEQQEVSIQIDTFGGAGGETNKINFTINFLGDPVAGEFDVDSGTFTEDSGS
ncbi:MAG: hypothetical protein JW908_04365 [Anaerolineales bacterium]|nr:hypothetical protein [Anaerolineales bacterium]